MAAAPSAAAVPVQRSARQNDAWALLRPRQWLKNGFVLAPLLFGLRLGAWPAWRAGLEATAAFCLAASAGYILNDLLDRERDRRHPVKRGRGLAAGRIQPRRAALLGLACLGGAAGLAAMLPAAFAIFLGAYLALTAAYSWRLKAAPILDVLLIAAGFVLRVLAGSAALRLPASHWILLCTFLLAAFLASVKRKAELSLLQEQAGGHRRALDGYNHAMLDQMAWVMLAAAIVSYALYTVAPETVARVGNDHLIYTAPFVVYGLLRYMQLANRNLALAGEGAEALCADRPLQICLALWLAGAILVLYR